jgi:hypothetical protein
MFTRSLNEQVLMKSVKTHGGLTRGKGISETQRLIWVLSMPACANINESMQIFSGTSFETSEQHKEISSSRQERDCSDTIDLITYLKDRDPFVARSSLFNIANGMAARDGVNVDRAKAIGEEILTSMVGKSVDEFTFKKSKQAVTLDSRSTVKIKGEPVRVDPQLIFQRLVSVGERREDDMASLFKYELCSHPPALFESSSLPLEVTKSLLSDFVWNSIKDDQRKPTGSVRYILDGGALLHRIPWPRGSTFDSICKMYVTHVSQKYGAPAIVFDGYNDGPSTKDVAHLRRTGGITGVAVHFTGGMVIQCKKEEFLSNAANKQRFIHLLSNHLEKIGCDIYHATGDADFLIVQTTLSSARTRDTVLIAEDADLLVMLLHYTEPNMYEVFLKQEPKALSKKKNKSWCIKQAQQSLGPEVCEHMLFIHAIMGCDTTSRLFGLGKSLALKKIKNDSTFRLQAKTFGEEEISKEDIIKAGEMALVSLYGGTVDEGLDSLRYRQFSEKAAKSTSLVEPQTIPPTSSAAKYHSLRVYYQMMEWKGQNSDMKPEEWGWHIVEGKYMPIQTDQPAAPSHLLDVICCNCKTDCSSRKCTCRKLGLHCSIACGECHGTSCENSQAPDLTKD